MDRNWIRFSVSLVRHGHHSPPACEQPAPVGPYPPLPIPPPPGSETSSTSQRRERTKASRPGSGADLRADDGGWSGSGAAPPLGADPPPGPAVPPLLMRAAPRLCRFARIDLDAGFEPAPNAGGRPVAERGVRSASGGPPWIRYYRTAAGSGPGKGEE